MAAEMELKFGVDVNGVLRGMDRAGKSLQDFKDQATRFKTALDKATDPKSIERLNRALEASTAKMRAIQSAGVGSAGGFSKFNTGTKDGTAALTDFNRVVQDAPFGLVGIGNNITQLTQSFGGLVKSTGGVGNAFKALFSSATGFGGFSLIISGIVTALSFASMGMGAWTRGLNGSKDATKDAAEELKQYQQSLKDTESGVLATGLKLQGFVNIARNSELSLKQRNEALKEANKIMGEHGEKLTLLNINTKEVTESINKFTQATIQQALASRFAERAADLIIKQRDAAKAFGVEMDKLNKQQATFDKNFNNNAASASEGAAARLQQGARALEDQKKSAGGAAAAYKTITKELQDITGQLSAAQTAAAGLFGELGTKEKEGKSSKVKEIKTITSVIGELAKEIDFLSAKQITFGTNEAEAKIAAIKSAIETLLRDFNVSPDDALINKLLTGGKIFNPVLDENIPGIKGLTQEVQERIGIEFENTPPVKINVPIDASPRLTGPVDQAAFERELAKQKWAEQLEAAAQSMRDTLSTSFAQIFSDIGAGMSAGGIFASFFKTIFTELGAGIQMLGIQSAIIQKLLAKLRLAFGTPGGIAAAVGLIALGGLIKGLASKIAVPKFADGVTNFSGGIAMVGERGPEMVRLPSGADVVPNHSLGAIGGGMSMNLSGNFRVAGTDLVLVLERANKSLSKVG